MFLDLAIPFTADPDSLQLGPMYHKLVYRAYSRVPMIDEQIQLPDDDAHESRAWNVEGVYWDNSGPPTILLNPIYADSVGITAADLERWGFRLLPPGEGRGWA